MKQEIPVEYWGNPDVDHFEDTFWIKEAMQSAIGVLWYKQVRPYKLAMPKNLSLTLDTERGVVVVSDEEG